MEKRPRLCTLTTPASTGAFRAQFDNLEEIQLVQESIAAFERFADHVELSGVDIGLQQQGYLWLTTTSEGATRQRTLVAQQRSWGLADVEFANLPDSDVILPDRPGPFSGDPGGIPLYINGIPVGGVGVAGDLSDTAPERPPEGPRGHHALLDLVAVREGDLLVPGQDALAEVVDIQDAVDLVASPALRRERDGDRAGLA